MFDAKDGFFLGILNKRLSADTYIQSEVNY